MEHKKESQYLESIRADIRTLRSARKTLVAKSDRDERTLKALEALDRRLKECVVELSQLRGYEPRLVTQPHLATA